MNIASKKKGFEKFKNASFFERNQKRIKTFKGAKIQYINYDVVKRIKNQRNEVCRNRKKIFKFKKIDFDFF